MSSLAPAHVVLLLVLIVVLIAIPFGLGFWASSLAKKKDRSPGGFFALGFFLGVVGVIIAAVVAPGQPGPPPGMRAVVCPRCNARQNVEARQPNFECWQCKSVIPVPA